MLSRVLLLALATGVSAKGIYRGVATNAWTGGCADLAALSNMSWYYNWDLSPTVDLSTCNFPLVNGQPRYIEFVPIVWGGSAQNIQNIVSKLPPGTKHLMAFNEPNFGEQANLTPQQAATAWMNVVGQLRTAGLLGKIRLGAPSASPGGSTSPQDWFTQFFQLCTDCPWDFLNFHIYDCNAPYYDAGGFNYWLGQAAAFNLPIWITEFTCPSQNPAVTSAVEISWMGKVLASMDSNAKVERYAWFTARATNVGTIPSLLTSTAGQLTDVGRAYNSAGDMLVDPTTGSGSPTTAAGTPTTAAGSRSPTAVGATNAPSTMAAPTTPAPAPTPLTGAAPLRGVSWLVLLFLSVVVALAALM